MKNKKLIFIIIGIFTVAFLIYGGLSLRFQKNDCRNILSGEDCWFCQNGEWVKHGNLSAPKPTKPCGESKENSISKGNFCGTSTFGNCVTDADCVTGGCSGEICQSKDEEPIIITCEYKDCYNTEKYELKCKCLTQQCQWGK